MQRSVLTGTNERALKEKKIPNLLILSACFSAFPCQLVSFNLEAALESHGEYLFIFKPWNLNIPIESESLGLGHGCFHKASK